MKRRVLITVEYFGKEYSGWQLQKNHPSVQGVLQDTLEKLLGHKVKLEASGRTDKGVHAVSQAAHFDTDTTIPTDRIPYAVNLMLPPTVSVHTAVEVPDDFHARYSVKQKTYLYKLYVSRQPCPLKEDFSCRLLSMPDVDRMNEACKYLIGTQDFCSFQATGSSIKSTVRTITRAEVVRLGNDLEFFITGNGFLYNMVRIITGTLVDIGLGKHSPEYMEEIIHSKNRLLASKTYPAKGLYLFEVKYCL